MCLKCSNLLVLILPFTQSHNLHCVKIENILSKLFLATKFIWTCVDDYKTHSCVRNQCTNVTMEGVYSNCKKKKKKKYIYSNEEGI